MRDGQTAVESPFLSKARAALEQLFERVRAKDELNFALSLAAEFKPYTYTSAMEAKEAYRDYSEFLQQRDFLGKGIHVRVFLSFYCYVAESAGLWCIPMSMLGVLDGGKYNTDPFRFLVRKYKDTDQNVAPNANKVMGTLARCSTALGLDALADVFTNAFDPDIRNGVSHADYVLSSEGIHVRGRHAVARIVSWSEAYTLLNDGIGLIQVLIDVVGKYERLYQTPVVVTGTSNPDDPPCFHLIYSDPITRTLSVSGGAGWTAESLLESHRIKRMASK